MFKHLDHSKKFGYESDYKNKKQSSKFKVIVKI